MNLVNDITQIEVGDTVKITEGNDSKFIAEGEIEFIDFTIPWGNIILQINGESHPVSDCDVFLVALGTRTPEQVAKKQTRLFQVINQMNRLK